MTLEADGIRIITPCCKWWHCISKSLSAMMCFPRFGSALQLNPSLEALQQTLALQLLQTRCCSHLYPDTSVRYLSPEWSNASLGDIQAAAPLYLFRPLSNRINEASTYYLKYIVLPASSMPYNSLVMDDFKKLRLETGKWNKMEKNMSIKSWSEESIKDNHGSLWLSTSESDPTDQEITQLFLALGFQVTILRPSHLFTHSLIQ